MHPGAAQTSDVPLRGLILAGGTGTRLGGCDKALLTLGDKPLLAHVRSRLAPQVDVLALSSNAPAEHYAEFDMPVVADRLPGLGPLAGVHAAARTWPNEYIVSVAVDLPFLPLDLVARLHRGWSGRDCRHAAIGGRHALAVLWPPGTAARLEAFLREEQSVYAWLTLHSTPVAFDGLDAIDLNVNINTPAELRAAQRYLMGETPALAAFD